MKISQPGPSKTSQKVPGTSRKKRRNKTRASGGTASIRFSRTELVSSVVLGADKKASGTVAVHPASCPILNKLAAAFERCRWERVQFYWKPMVSAMFSGSVAMGVDWDNATAATTRSAIAAYAPSRVLPLREDMEKNPLRIDPSRLKARQWWAFNDGEVNISRPCTLAWAAEGEKAASVGEIYMTYTVVLDGPHA